MGPKMAKRIRRSYEQIFIDKLKELSGGEQKLVGNVSLRDTLEWPQDLYNRIKSELKAKNAIILGRGYGGTVALANAPGAKSLSLFISYSHADERFKIELIKHIKPLERLGLIDQWHDRKLKAGEQIDTVISSQLNKADIIMLLISVDFVNSEYCYEIEMEEAIRRHESGTARVIPIILRSCMWTQAPFGKLLALPKDGRAVTSWPTEDEAFTNIAEGVRAVAEDLLENR
jgi:hypothetical protein